jgi:two-component system, NtrC family, response regulator HydG
MASKRERPKGKQLIEALRQAGGNLADAARIWGLSRGTVWNRRKKFGIDPKRNVR